MKQGEHKSYYEDSTLQYTQTYLNDKLHGVCEYYQSNGSLGAITNYVNGKRCGMYKLYNIYGDVDYISYWINDERSTEIEWLVYQREEQLNKLI